MSSTIEVRPVASVHAELGESPFWHPGEQVLYWCDIPACRLYRLVPASGALKHWDFEAELASAAPCRSGGLLLALRNGLWRFDPADGRRSLLAAAPYDAAHERFNDGKCDPGGRFWCGTLYEPRRPPLAALYRLDAAGALTREADGVTVSNGLAWSPNGCTMYWSDTTSHTVFALDFDLAQGRASRRRVFARFEPRREGQSLDDYGGRPDGAAVDAEGNYWVAMFEGGRLLQLSPRGELRREIRLPVRCPTMPCFGGPDLRTLYVTTARHHRPADELAAQPWAGCVLEISLDVPGLPVAFYAG